MGTSRSSRPRPPPRPRAAIRFAALLGFVGLSSARTAADAPAPSPSTGFTVEMVPGSDLLEPPVPVELTFAPDVPPGVTAPAALGALRYAVVKGGEPVGPAGGFVVATTKDGSRLYVDADGDGDLSNGGDGALEAVGDWKVRRAILAVRRAPGDVETATPLPYVFVRTEGDAPRWFVVGTGLRTGTLSFQGKDHAVALTDGDQDGRIAGGGADVLWFDANDDGAFDPKPEAHERWKLPAVLRVGTGTLRLGVEGAAGTLLRVTPAEGQEPGVASAAPPATLASWRLFYVAASPTNAAARVAAVAGARALHDDAAWAWVTSLTVGTVGGVRNAAIDALGDPAFGADRSEKALEKVALEALDTATKQRALGLLAGHPGAGAASFLAHVADEKARAVGERQAAVRALAAFEGSTAAVRRHMNAQEAPEVRLAAYEGLARRSPKDKSIHALALEVGPPAARGEAILALAGLGDPRGLQLARKEATSRFAELRGAAARVLVTAGKPTDLPLAFAAAEDDRPTEKYTDLNRNGRWDPGEPFVDANGNGVYDADSGIRAGLVEALKSVRDRADVREHLLKKALGDDLPKDAWVRGVAIDVLGGVDDAAVRAAVLARLGAEHDRDNLLKLLAVAGATKGPVPVAELLKLALEKDEGVRAAASSAAVDAALDDPAVRAFVLQLLASSQWSDRVQGAEAATRAKLAEAVPLLVANLAHERWSVRLASVEALAQLRPKQAVDGLLALMAKEGAFTRLSVAARRALVRITGMDLPDDPDQWKAWLAAHDGFQVPAEPPDDRPAAGKTVARFFGIAVESARVVFVLDRSGSMTILDSSGDAIRSRWEALQEQATRAVTGLSKGAKFNLVFFSDTVDAFRPKSVDATESERAEAKRFLKGVEPRGETNLWGGLLVALDDPDVDTVIVLSDGEPTMGEFTKAGDLLRETSLRNRFRRIAISTISLGGDSPFLRELAAQNHGTYVRR